MCWETRRDGCLFPASADENSVRAGAEVFICSVAEELGGMVTFHTNATTVPDEDDLPTECDVPALS